MITICEWIRVELRGFLPARFTIQLGTYYISENITNVILIFGNVGMIYRVDITRMCRIKW